MRGALAALCLSVAVAWVFAATRAAGQPSPGVLELSFVPADRSQIAVWVERADGTFMGTLALTHATATAGIGNRPGALQMNSGFRWPYGRREGVLPVWAHRRAAAPGAKSFRRVIFQDRSSEGAASRTSSDQSVDNYYCLSFQTDTTTRDALDAVTCASVFSSDKGRFITSGDVKDGYAEPWEEDGRGSMRELSLNSLYPPRRNVTRCTASGCYDHADVAQFKKHAASVMPEIDAVSRATPAGRKLNRWRFEVPSEWALSEAYNLFVEVNVEGDYSPAFDPELYDTPKLPEGRWDSWAMSYGYPYRGQPSVVYELPFRLDRSRRIATSTPVGFGEPQGLDGELRAMSNVILDDPGRAPGSGADRLREQAGIRAELSFTVSDPCASPEPPVECGQSCEDDAACGILVCGPSAVCESECTSAEPLPAVLDLSVEADPDRQHAHMWAVLSLTVPELSRHIGSFDVRLRAAGGDWEEARTQDPDEPLLPVALDLCADPDNPRRDRCAGLAAGDELSVGLSGLFPSTDYEISVSMRDSTCNVPGLTAVVSYRSPARRFSTVSPCFVATAAYGSPLADEIHVLRRFRDRYLASHGLGRALIGLYYQVGPTMADTIRDRPWARALTRSLLSPLVHVLNWWMS